MEFLDTIRQVKNNWQPYKKWELDQQRREKQNDELNKRYPSTIQEREHAKQYGRTIIDVINTMDQHSIDKSEDASLMVGTYGMTLGAAALVLFVPLNKLIEKIPIVKNTKTKACALLVTAFLENEVVIVMLNILQAKYEKQASRIARYQTREIALKDYRNFVVYNDQQIKEAEKIAESLPEVKEQTKLRKKGFHPIDDYKNAQITVDLLKKDNKNYEKWKESYLKTESLKKEKFKTLTPSQSELSKAERDRNSLLGTIKKIETSSLDSLNNMIMAVSLAITGLILAVFTGGHGLNKIIDKALPKIKCLEERPLLVKNARLFNLSVLPLLVPVIMLSSVVKILKDSARVGRFKAKQELLNNPEKFVSYDDNQSKQSSDNNIKDIKQKSFLEKIAIDLNEVKNFKQDYVEYGNYMKTKHKEELKLNEALKKIEISEKQKIDAIELQKKAFHSFEKMDEKAQRFTDDSQAAVDIVSQIFMGLATCVLRVNGVIKSSELFDKNKIISSNKMLKELFPMIVLPQLIYPIVKIIGTRFKKDSGKVGIMIAMQDLEDPKNFLDENGNKNPAPLKGKYDFKDGTNILLNLANKYTNKQLV